MHNFLAASRTPAVGQLHQHADRDPCPRSLRPLFASLSLSQMTLKYCDDMSAADWIVQAHIPYEQLLNFGPSIFPAYARLRFIPDPTRPGQTEADANVAEDHPSDMEQARRALDHLRRFTATPDDCYFCVWEGYPIYFPPAVLDGPMVTIPHRRYFLLHGSLADLGSWDETLGGGYVPPPAFAWPADITGASPAMSTPTGPESEPSKQRSTHSSTPLSLTSSQLNQPSLNPPTTSRHRGSPYPQHSP
jgi:hypothetical protein